MPTLQDGWVGVLLLSWAGPEELGSLPEITEPAWETPQVSASVPAPLPSPYLVASCPQSLPGHPSCGCPGPCPPWIRLVELLLYQILAGSRLPLGLRGLLEVRLLPPPGCLVKAGGCSPRTHGPGSEFFSSDHKFFLHLGPGKRDSGRIPPRHRRGSAMAGELRACSLE